MKPTGEEHTCHHPHSFHAHTQGGGGKLLCILFELAVIRYYLFPFRRQVNSRADLTRVSLRGQISMCVLKPPDSTEANIEYPVLVVSSETVSFGF